MTDEKFTELVNLYLDQEISADELSLLKAEIAAKPERKRVFTELRRLHEGMLLALKAERQRSRRSVSRSRSASSRKRRRSSVRPVTRISDFEDSVRAPAGSGLPRWFLVSGMAASVLLGFLLLPPVFRNTTDRGAQPELVGTTERELVAQDPLDSFGRSELRRFVALQEQREVESHSSLVAQMRLMGLRPELTPKDKQLKEVNLAAVYKPKQEVSQAELFQRIQGVKTMPETKLLRIEESDAKQLHWPTASEALPVSFHDEATSAIRF